jgi:hypothetical protein
MAESTYVPEVGTETLLVSCAKGWTVYARIYLVFRF